MKIITDAVTLQSCQGRGRHICMTELVLKQNIKNMSHEAQIKDKNYCKNPSERLTQQPFLTGDHYITI